MELECAAQNYAWGKIGSDSVVARLVQASVSDFVLDENKPYAELWMGTHPNGPSIIKGGKPLSEYIAENPDCLGSNIRQKFDRELPFLFKVLSVHKALSIQAHPNKAHAEELHAARPDIYRDPNHKPEMTIALTPFVALCGFRPKEQIIGALSELFELRALVGEGPCLAFEASPTTANLQLCYKNLMTSQPGEVKKQVEALATRLNERQDGFQHVDSAPLFLALNAQFPGDVGCFSVFLMNVVHLNAGEAIFLAANVPHAYISGDCVECMACSDNVVRAGLTPKYKDVETLVQMLDYTMQPNQAFQPSERYEFTEVYAPPVPDFALESIEVPSNTRHTLRTLSSASILLTVGGEASLECQGGLTLPNAASSLQKGSVLFSPAECSVIVSTDAQNTLTAFRAFVA